MKLFSVILMIFSQIGCSTNNKKNIYYSVGSSVIAGAVIGSSLAPEGENKDAHALLWSGIAGTIASLIAINVFDDSKKAESLNEENNNLKLELSRFQEQFNPKLISKGNSSLNSPIPNELRSLVKPGSWEHYKLDRWVKSEDEEHVWYRQTEMFQLQLPESN